MAFYRYNTTRRNTAQYNASAHYVVTSLSESVTGSDLAVDRPEFVLAEALNLLTSSANTAVLSHADFVFLVDTLSKLLTQRTISETVRVNDWIEVERKNIRGWSH